MSIKEIAQKCKSPKVFWTVLVILIVFALTGLIRLSYLTHEKTPISIIHPQT